MKPSILKQIVYILLALGFANCENDMNSPKDYDGVQESWNLFIENWNQLNAEGCMAIYFDDAVLIPPQLLELKGKPAIKEFYESLFSMNQKAEYNHTTESINFSKEQAVEVGNFSVKWITSEGDSSTYHARTMVHWQKDQLGDWKIKTLLFNNPPMHEED